MGCFALAMEKFKFKYNNTGKILRLRGMKKNFELGQKKFFFSFMNPLYDPILVFPKFDPLAASGIAL
jgi:hypothetical protein